MKYVVVSRLSPEAIAEFREHSDTTHHTPPMIYPEAHQEKLAREALPLKILDGPGGTRTIGMMYAEVWIEDEAGNRVTSPEKRVEE